jgi:hypothetical protein
MINHGPKSIDFCIPFIGKGIVYFEYLLENCINNADFPDRINFIVSYHTKQDLRTLQKSKLFDRIDTLIHVKPFDDQLLFVGSANHSAAINEFTRIAKSDLFVISDYDMAFVYQGWDSLLERLAFIDKKLICGTAYATNIMTLSNPYFSNMPWLSSAQLLKYQGVPNLSFFSLTLELLETLFFRKLTNFYLFLASGSIPFRIISTPEQVQATNLKLGSIQWLDTGWEIPEIIHSHNINCETFNYHSLSSQIVIKDIEPFNKLPLLFQPEFFSLSDGTPFLCHYKKGSTKINSFNNASLFDLFTTSIEAYLQQISITHLRSPELS